MKAKQRRENVNERESVRESERDPAAAGLTINQKQLQIEAETSKKNQQKTVRKTTSDKSEEKRGVECSGEERRGEERKVAS